MMLQSHTRFLLELNSQEYSGRLCLVCEGSGLDKVNRGFACGQCNGRGRV